jgi:hypothetical protein
MNARFTRWLALLLLLALFAAFGAWAQEAMPPEDEQPTFRAVTEGVPATGDAASSGLSVPKALLLGAVEGITEYLPVSSTGHLLVVGRLLGLWRNVEEKAAADAYAICIQLGAILAVFVISFPWIRRMVLGLIGRDAAGLRLAGCLVLAFVPAALIGLALEDRLKQYLFNVPAVAAAWVAGGLFILLALRKSGSAGRAALGYRPVDRAGAGPGPVARGEPEPGHHGRGNPAGAQRAGRRGVQLPARTGDPGRGHDL